MRKQIGVLGFLICLMMFISTSAMAAKKMPSFILSSVLDGKEISSSEFEKKTLLVTFFATWCPPCVQEVPTLKKLQKKYGKDDFSVVALSVDQDERTVVKEFVEKMSINYPVLMANSKTMQDFGGVYGIPVSFLVNKEGNVVKRFPGYIPQSILEKDLKKIL